MLGSSAYSLKIRTGSLDDNAVLMLVDGELVAILVELRDKGHEDSIGAWCVEATFGLSPGRIPTIFPTAQDAADWICGNAGSKPCHVEDGLPVLA